MTLWSDGQYRDSQFKAASPLALRIIAMFEAQRNAELVQLKLENERLRRTKQLEEQVAEMKGKAKAATA